MRVAQGHDAIAPDGTPYWSPDRPRIADAGQRTRLARYLAAGTPVTDTHLTDGVWVWHGEETLAALERGVAPEGPFLQHIEEAGYRPPDTVPVEAVSAARRALAAEPEPPDPPGFTVDYYIRVDADYPPEQPLSLLRRIRLDDDAEGSVIDQAVWRDLRWHPTQAFVTHERTGDFDLRPITAERASEVLDTWCARWSSEAAQD